MADKVDVFDLNTNEYDQWFANHTSLYQSEIQALQKAIPAKGKGIEIGVGTGRFAEPFNIKYGVEPSANMARIAEKRGIKVIEGFAEELPVKDGSFDFALMVTTVCFLNDPPKAFSEINRILRPGGAIIFGIIDRNSELGRKYEKEKATSKFYKDAHFHATNELTASLQQAGFHHFTYWQTLVNPEGENVEQPIEGFGKGSFVVIKAEKV